MIIGIGTDMVSIKRIESIQYRSGDRLARRILTVNELETYYNRHRSSAYLASRFAAKEAVSKALGTGIGRVSFQDIETWHNEQGIPQVLLWKYAKDLSQRQTVKSIYLSLSDEKEYALAFVILEA